MTQIECPVRFVCHCEHLAALGTAAWLMQTAVDRAASGWPQNRGDTMSVSILSRIARHKTLRSSARAHAPRRWKLVIATLAVATTAASAAIVATAPAFTQIAPPAAVVLGALQSDVDLFAFNERQCFQLPVPLQTDNGVIPKGTLVSSHFLHGDPVNTLLLDGRVLFNGPILGVISTTLLLDASDATCGAAGVVYPTGTEINRGLEVGQPDGYAIIAGGFGIVARMDIPPASFSDQIRVITRCCPGGACPGAPDGPPDGHDDGLD
jgi:hypothetical protein